MCSQHIKKIKKLIDSFQSEPKVIDGFKIKKWFNIGEYIFEEFYELGSSVQWQYSALRSHPEIGQVIAGVKQNQQWLQTFVSLYPSLRLDLDGGYPARYICRLRSGIQVLLQGLDNIDSSFNPILTNLFAKRELEEFDRQLRIWCDNGYRPCFSEGDLKLGTPETHWWWF